MSLKSRLSSLKRQRGASVEKEKLGITPAISERIGRYRVAVEKVSPNRAGKDDEALARLLEGDLIAPGVIKVERRICLSGHHGSVELAGLINSTVNFPSEDEIKVGNCLFFDTETTGLSGGTGTSVFMLGMGRVEGEEFVVCQLMMSSFAAESAFLQTAEDWAKEAETLVSFNGKCFDSPLLSTRYRMKSLADPFDGKQHVDLLYPVRRAFSNQWQDCRLATTEQNLLGFTRTNDLPGAQAPEAWLAYLRFGQTKLLPRVAEHNYWDIVSLAALMVSLPKVYSQPVSYKADLLAVSRIHISAGRINSALELLEQHRSQLSNEALLELARIYRKLKLWDDARKIWQGLAIQGCSESAERLAKYYEHVDKNYHKALQYAERLPDSRHAYLRIDRLSRRIDSQGRLFG